MKISFPDQTPSLLKGLGAVIVLAALSSCSSNSDSNYNAGLSANNPAYSSSGNQTDSSSSVGKGNSSAGGEFEAVINDFVDYQNWTLADYVIGATNPNIGGAHGAGVDTLTRKTFMNATAATSIGGFAPGAIIIKEVFSYTTTENGLEKTLLPSGGLVAMVKRGGNFNPDHNGWEWFMLERDLSSVVAQGADLGNGACSSCHGKASGQDYVFAKPTEIIVEAELFLDYASWDLIAYNTSPSNLAAGAHVNDASLRRVFQKQLFANPVDGGDLGYPTGTTLVKDISKDDAIQQIVAMVKRGGQPNPNNGNWEFFVLDPANPAQIMVDATGSELRGALANCVSCHASAVDDKGIDFVFKHADAPFNTNTTGEFVANKADFANYTTWNLSEYALGSSNPFIGSAHGSGNTELSRAVFQNGKAQMVENGEYPPGSIIVKETFSTLAGEKQLAETGGLLAMVKRGGNFNPDHHGWEWFSLSAGGAITARSGDLKGGACNSCHANAEGDAGSDYSFNKPSEKIALLADFVDYKSWTQIDETTGDSAANGGAHGIDTIRKTFKKYPLANPNFEAGEYPTGTVIVKEVTVDNNITRLLAMVKRGGNFNVDHGNWQWFTINPDLSAITDLGVGAGCTGCHGKAGSSTETDPSFAGKDYVFFHKNDPVVIE